MCLLNFKIDGNRSCIYAFLQIEYESKLKNIMFASYGYSLVWKLSLEETIILLKHQIYKIKIRFSSDSVLNSETLK